MKLTNIPIIVKDWVVWFLRIAKVLTIGLSVATFYTAMLLFPVILIHELGHYLVAKMMGYPIESFFIGFGPTLFSWSMFGTEFGFKPILIGGYNVPPEGFLKNWPAFHLLIISFAGVAMNVLSSYLIFWYIIGKNKIFKELFPLGPINIVSPKGFVLWRKVTPRNEMTKEYLGLTPNEMLKEYMGVSMLVGIINLIPITLVLDGGKMFYVLIRSLEISDYYRGTWSVTTFILLLFFTELFWAKIWKKIGKKSLNESSPIDEKEVYLYSVKREKIVYTLNPDESDESEPITKHEVNFDWDLFDKVRVG